MPRRLRAPLARLCWRTGQPAIGLRLLRTTVGIGGKVAATASPEELSEYAACLIGVGALPEALKLLDEKIALTGSQTPLYRAFAYISQWRYQEAHDQLLPFVKSLPPGDYGRAVAEVNLAATLVFTRQFPAAEKLLIELEKRLAAEGWFRLLSNCLELHCEVELQMRQIDRAERALGAYETLTQQKGFFDPFVTLKWRSIVRFAQSPQAAGARAQLRRFRQVAQQRQRWESARESDRFFATFGGDLPLLFRLYFGTPYPLFRNYLVHGYREPVALPAAFGWGAPGGKTLDIATAAYGGEGVLKVGLSPHRLLVVLSKDFYRPQSLGALFSQLFPGEHFDRYYAQLRVSQAVDQLRRALGKHRLPLAVKVRNGAYRLELGPECRILTRAESPPDDKLGYVLHALHTHFGDSLFSNEDAARVLHRSAHATRALLAQSRRSGQVLRFGERRGCQYRLAPR